MTHLLVSEEFSKVLMLLSLLLPVLLNSDIKLVLLTMLLPLLVLGETVSGAMVLLLKNGL